MHLTELARERPLTSDPAIVEGWPCCSTAPAQAPERAAAWRSDPHLFPVRLSARLGAPIVARDSPPIAHLRALYEGCETHQVRYLIGLWPSPRPLTLDGIGSGAAQPEIPRTACGCVALRTARRRTCDGSYSSAFNPAGPAAKARSTRSAGWRQAHWRGSLRGQRHAVSLSRPPRNRLFDGAPPRVGRVCRSHHHPTRTSFPSIRTLSAKPLPRVIAATE